MISARWASVSLRTTVCWRSGRGLASTSAPRSSAVVEPPARAAEHQDCRDKLKPNPGEAAPTTGVLIVLFRQATLLVYIVQNCTNANPTQAKPAARGGAID